MSGDEKKGQARILVIDDDEDFRLILTRALEKEGYRVQAVGSGAEAIEALKSQKFDLTLVDIKMPEMGGRETVKEIRKLDPQLPVLLVTGSPDLPDRELQDQAQGWIYKPFRLAQLRSIVRKLLEEASQ
ncbi:MAG: response regulator [Anaerolineae bacterium]|nr:response regulator [Anaerolineae bacterium]